MELRRRVRRVTPGRATMTRVFRIIIAASAVLASLLLASPVAAGTGAEYSLHVSECARAGHFSGDHNPGLHQGFSGWPGR